MPKKLLITLKKSPIGYEKSQKATVAALGLRKLGQTVEKDDSPAVLGMINKISHLLAVDSDAAGMGAVFQEANIALLCQIRNLLNGAGLSEKVGSQDSAGFISNFRFNMFRTGVVSSGVDITKDRLKAE